MTPDQWQRRCASARAGTALSPSARAAWQLPGAWMRLSSRALTLAPWRDLIGAIRCCLAHHMPDDICATAGTSLMHLVATPVLANPSAQSWQAQCEVIWDQNFIHTAYTIIHTAQPVQTAPSCAQVMSKRGVSIAYVGGSSSIIAAGGYNAEAGNVALWDTMAPLSSGAIAYLDHHSSLVTALQVI